MAKRKTRDLSRTRQEILDVAFWEFFLHGFQGVSVDDIIAKTRLTKGALYHQFPTKLELGYAVVEDVIRPLIQNRWITPLENHKDPLLGILEQMKILIGKATPEQLKLGCPLNNLVQEMAPLDRGFSERLNAALQYWIDQLEIQLQRGQKAGYVKKHADCRRIAVFVVMSHEGFYGMLKGMPDRRLFKAMYESLEEYLMAFHQSPGRRSRTA